MMTVKPRFVIWTPPWDESSGGVIALHTLCHRLNGLGISAALWPDTKPSLRGQGWRHMLRYGPSYALRGARRFAGGPFDGPIARASDLTNAVVVYPEVVAGNPLGARKVARWFLHRPGHHTGVAEFGDADECFFYVPAFDDFAFKLGPERWLRVTYINPAYQRTNDGPRQGAAYIVRKGAHRTLDRHPVGAIRVDEMNHEEKAVVFNRVETFYAYDPYTLYTLYASLCGCTSVFLPEDGVSLEQWSPGERPPGLAYGADDLDYARRTQADLVDKVARDLLDEDAMMLRFAATCEAAFAACD